MNLILFQVTLPAPGAADVVARELTMQVGGEAPVAVPVVVGQAVVDGLKAPQDSSVTLSLVDVDDAGNRSLPSIFQFVAQDTLAPPQPGELGVVMTGEEIVPDPLPEPPAE
jgi:hypothetical protein